ncbi:MAG: hypothetical protein ACRDIY_10580 [Chloroflexota bacterium]
MADNAFKEEYCGNRSEQGPSKAHPRFPRSVCETRWITSPSEHESHPGQSLVTRDHAVIRQWAEERNAVPATVPGTRHDGHLGVLRFDVPGYGRRTLEHVTWDQWFNTLDDRKLVMIYQERMENGQRSNFSHFNSPDREHQ